MRHLLFAAILLLTTGYQGFTQTTTVSPQLMGHINDKKLKEASGIASSVPLKNCFWSHNDSGNKPDVYLLNNKAAVISVFNVENGTNKDWEDIAEGLGPVKGKYYVYVADIGDNSGTRDHIRIYRFPEPTTKPQPKVNITADILQLEYPDQPKDAESLMIDPISRQIYIISKRQKAVHLYKTKLDFKDGDKTTLQKLITLPFTWVVSADISKDGHHIVLKTLTTVYYWNRKNGETVEQAMARPGKQLPYQPEAQGEAITILPDNSGYVTISEGKAAPMYFYKWKF